MCHKLITYDDIKWRLNSGDILLFSGDSFFSRIVECVTWSRWSHVGMVYAPAGCKPLLWESVRHGTGLKDHLTNRIKKDGGTQLVDLETRIRNYKGSFISVRKIYLKTANYKSLQTRIERCMRNFMKEAKQKKFESNLSEIWCSIFHCNTCCNNEEDTHEYFCSELIAETYIRIGLLPPPCEFRPSNQYVPDDFGWCDHKLLKDDLPFNEGVFLGPEIIIRGTTML